MPNFMCRIKCTYPNNPNTETALDDGMFSFSSQTEGTKWIQALNTILMQPRIESSFIVHALEPITAAGINSIERFSAALHQCIAKHIGLVASYDLKKGLNQLPIPENITVALVDDNTQTHGITFTPSQWRQFHTFCTRILDQQKKLVNLELSDDPFQSISLHVTKRRNRKNGDDATRTSIASHDTLNDDDLSILGMHRRQRAAPNVSREQQPETPTAHTQNRRERAGVPPSPPVNRVLTFDESETVSPNIQVKRRKPARFKDTLDRVETNNDTSNPNPISTIHQSKASSPDISTSTNTPTPLQSTGDTLAEKPSQKIALDAMTAAGFVGGFLSAGAGAWLLFNASSAAAASGASTALGALMLANPAIPILIGLASVLAIAATSVIIARQPRVKACSKQLFQRPNPPKQGGGAVFDKPQ